MNDLVVKINSLDIGIEIDNEKVSILLYADDLALVSSSENDIQILLQKLNTGIKINEQDRVMLFDETLPLNSVIKTLCLTVELSLCSMTQYTR